MKHKITYHFDALCGWCYGFTNVMAKIYDKYNSEFEFDVISGGLFKESRVGLINDVAPYIKNGAYKVVEERTGVVFGEDFIENGLVKNNIYLDSLPPAIALALIKKHAPNKKMEYAEALLKAFYLHGKNTNDWKVYESIAYGLNISIENFSTEIQKKIYLEAAKNEFQNSALSNINGFPALSLTIANQTIILSNGYVDFETIDRKLKEITQF